MQVNIIIFNFFTFLFFLWNKQICGCANVHNGHWQMLWNNKKKGIKFNFFWDACLLKGLGTSSTAARNLIHQNACRVRIKAAEKGWNSTGGKWDRCKLRTIFVCSFSRNLSNKQFYVCLDATTLSFCYFCQLLHIACCHREWDFKPSSRLLCKHTHLRSR